MEADVRYIIDNKLMAKGWILSSNSPDRNVFFESPRTSAEKRKLKGKFPDYVLYAHNKPIAVIEAKRTGQKLEKAIGQGRRYAENLNAPLVFGANGAYCQTLYAGEGQGKGKNLFLNGSEVTEFIRQSEALKFLEQKSNSIYTLPEKVIISRQELIKEFAKINTVLRSEGIRAGYDRLSEFSNLLFVKLLSEHKAKYTDLWNSIKNQSDNDIIGYINGVVIQKIEGEYKGGVFAPVTIQNGETMRNIIEVLDPLLLNAVDTDIKGDAFEYFIEKTTSTQNDLGEYFTPRHIVRTIINLVNPRFRETLYDPFCGTGGFLTVAYNHIKETAKLETKEELQYLQDKTLTGRELTTTARIAKMNMILHGDGHTGVEQADSLKQPKDNEFDVVVTNMPFSQRTKYGDLYYNGIGKKSGDAACVLHCFRALKEGGRMALIVPEGFLFKKELAEVRKFLLDNSNLQTVISLPPGVFLPYTNAKTNILYFTDAHKTKTDKSYWYFTVKNDGFTLNNNRKQIKGINDLHKLNASAIGNTSLGSGEKAILKQIGFDVIPINKIRENNFNLVGRWYKHKKANEKFVTLDKIADIAIGNSAPQEAEYFKNGKYPFFRVSDLAKTHLNNNLLDSKDKVNDLGVDKKNLRLFPKNTILFPKSGATIRLNHRALIGRAGYVVSHLAGIIPNTKYILPKYLYYLLIGIDAEDLLLNDGYPSIRKEDLENIAIPLPSKTEQKKIIDQIEKENKMMGEHKKRIQAGQAKMDRKLKSMWEDNNLTIDKSVFDILIEQAAMPVRKEEETKD